MMMDKKQQTIDTYNRSASQMAIKFNNIGARVEDIEEVFALIKKANPFVLEIGCGNGRDATEIVKRTNNYLGVDIAEEFIKIARENVPQGRFEVRDIEAYDLPEGLDIVFAFASLIHTPKEKLMKIIDKIYNSLNTDGIVFLSMKYSDQYSEVIKEDEFGSRTFYLYSKKDVEELGKDFHILRNDVSHLRGQEWLKTILMGK